MSAQLSEGLSSPEDYRAYGLGDTQLFGELGRIDVMMDCDSSGDGSDKRLKKYALNSVHVC